MGVILVLALGLLQMAVAMPPITLQDLEVSDDTASVGSYIREVRAAAPQDYHKSYENEGDGEIGYSRKKSGGGKKGYQHFDSFHKKAGDDFEFEKQDSFGHDDGGQDGAYSHRDEQRERYVKPKKQQRSAKYEEPEYERYEESPAAERDDQHDNRNNKKEKHYEELKEGASDGNGGVEAYGHDPSDYVLPEKYIVDEIE